MNYTIEYYAFGRDGSVPSYSCPYYCDPRDILQHARYLAQCAYGEGTARAVRVMLNGKCIGLF